MDKAQALHSFWSGFGLTAYDENTVPDGAQLPYITYEVEGDPYMQRGMKSSSYDVPDDPDEIIDNPTVEIGSIEVCDNEGHCVPIRDNGIVKQALEQTAKHRQ